MKRLFALLLTPFIPLFVFSQDQSAEIARLKAEKQADSIRHIQELDETERAMSSQNLGRNFGLGGAMIGFAGMAAGFYMQLKRRQRATLALEKEKKKSDDLLLNILPAEVAEELKNTGSTEARHYDNVTVLFTDFVGFTQTAEQMSPQELVNELHYCFRGFDEIIGKYGIEKIKTIGDAYLAACGLPQPDEQHAEKMVRAAMEMLEFVNIYRQQKGSKAFNIRIGIHSGGVVAGVVGVKKFAFDIWGDAVNIAARMEQSGEANKINVSQATYDLVKDKFAFTSRGEIDAKNKGKMPMYFADGAKAATPVNN